MKKSILLLVALFMIPTALAISTDCHNCSDCTDQIDTNCGGTETNCKDETDNDCDGAKDCNDTDCANDPACNP